MPDLRSASDVRKGLLSAADDRTREKPLSRPRTPPRRPPSKGGRRITWSRSLATAPGQHTFQPTDGGYTSAASDDQFHATTAPSEYTHGTGGGGSSGDAQADMPSGQASGATCVQKLDDSRNSAIHTTYRISLRSSSLREPRYPLLRVVCYSSKFASPSGGARAPGEGKEGSDSLGRTWCVAHPRGKNPTPARVRPPGELAAKGPNSHRKPEQRTRRRAPRTGGPHASEARPPGSPPASARSPGGRKRVRRVYRSVCAMILPQVHLRKPCYDFSFL